LNLLFGICLGIWIWDFEFSIREVRKMAVNEQEWTEHGEKDAARHREKIKKAIRENIADIISEESIITKKGDDIVKVPVKGIKSYHFKHGEKGGAGAGQGKGKKGDVIGQRKKGGKPDRKAGDEPGIDYLETEITIEKLIEMMLKDLGLPKLQKKETAQLEIPKGWTFEDIEKKGLQSNLDKKRTIKQAIKRTAVFVKTIMEEAGCTKEEAEAALWRAKGDINEALELLKKGRVTLEEGEVPKPYIFNDDLRFRTLKEDVEYQSNAVIIAMMDVSGSMSTYKKYIARSFFWWMKNFLETIYENVRIIFVSHHAEAKIVDEETFFHKGESGGTHCWSAYDLAHHLTETEFPTEKWNIYAFHFSDGDDWDTRKTVESVKKLLPRCNMVGYGEIHDQMDDVDWLQGKLMKDLVKGLNLHEIETEDGLEIFENTGEEALFLGITINGKEDIYPALREFLKKER